MKLRVTDSASAISEKQVLVSVNNTPPAVEITSPLPGTLYSMTQDEVHVLSADISDLEHGPGELACAWRFDLHHNDHIHSEPVSTDCEAMAPTSPVGCDGNTYFFRATLTVTDAHGLATTRSVDLLPNCTNAQADLGVSVTDAPDPVLVGGSITYSITVANTGTNNVEGVTVTDTLPAGTTLLSAPGYCALAAGKVICSLGAFGVGQSESLSLVVRANVAGAKVNTVEVTSLTAESNAANNTASASTLVTGNQVPTAHPQSVSLAEDTSRALTLTGSDPEGGALTFQIATNPAHGSLAGTGASRTYTPAANYNGADGFTFTVRDPSGNTSAPAAVSISVSPVNDAPVAVAQSISMAEDTARPITLGATDVDGREPHLHDRQRARPRRPHGCAPQRHLHAPPEFLRGRQLRVPGVGRPGDRPGDRLPYRDRRARADSVPNQRGGDKCRRSIGFHQQPRQGRRRGLAAGSVSTSVSSPGNGAVQFTASETTSRRMRGLNRGILNQTDYGARLRLLPRHGRPALQLRERLSAGHHDLRDRGHPPDRRRGWSGPVPAQRHAHLHEARRAVLPASGRHVALRPGRHASRCSADGRVAVGSLDGDPAGVRRREALVLPYSIPCTLVGQG